MHLHFNAPRLEIELSNLIKGVLLNKTQYKAMLACMEDLTLGMSIYGYKMVL